MKKTTQTKSLKQFLAMFAFIIVIAASNNVFSQNGVGINPTGAPADPSAAIDVSSTTKGALVPRMTAAQKTAIVSPANGLLIYQTDGVTGFWYFDGTNWVQAVGPQGAAGATGATGGYPVHTIGESYGGGIVFYVYDNGQHGLIAATADQSTGIQWYNGSFTITNAVLDGIGAGKFNTERIIANQGPGNYAAQICAYYQGGDYGDWYLPSHYELNLLYLQQAVFGNFANGYYWSSTETAINIAWYQDFSNSGQFGSNKNWPQYVRAIRAF